MVTESIPLNREKDGKLYRSALEEDPTVLAGNYEAAYNTMYSGETAEAATVEYSLGSDLVIEKLTLRLCHTAIFGKSALSVYVILLRKHVFL